MTNVFLSLFIFADLPEGQADDLTKLAAFDMEKLPDAEKLGKDFIRRHQELMLMLGDMQIPPFSLMIL